jgi:hypothetical protein
MIESQEKTEASEFHNRVKQVKLDPIFSGYANRISGLLERSSWVFVCSEHVSARLKDERELKLHFKNKAHTRPVFRS